MSSNPGSIPAPKFNETDHIIKSAYLDLCEQIGLFSPIGLFLYENQRNGVFTRIPADLIAKFQNAQRVVDIYTELINNIDVFQELKLSNEIDQNLICTFLTNSEVDLTNKLELCLLIHQHVSDICHTTAEEFDLNLQELASHIQDLIQNKPVQVTTAKVVSAVSDTVPAAACNFPVDEPGSTTPAEAFFTKYANKVETNSIHKAVYSLLRQYCDLFPEDQLDPQFTPTFSVEEISQLAPFALEVLNSGGVTSKIINEAQRIMNNQRYTQAASAMLRDIVMHSYALFVKTTTYGFSYSGIVQNTVLQISIKKAQREADTINEDFKAAKSLQKEFAYASVADAQEEIQTQIRKLSAKANITANYIHEIAKDGKRLLDKTTSRQLNELLEKLNEVAQFATQQSNQVATLRRQVDTSIWKASKGRHVASHQVLQSHQDTLRRKLRLEASQAKCYEGVTNPEYSEDVMDTPTPETVSMPKLETAGLTRVDSHNTLGLNRDHEDSLQVADTEVIEAVDQYYALFHFMYRLYGVHSTAVNINELKAEAEQYGITDIDGLKNKINEFAHIELPEDLDSLDDIIAGISAVFSKVQDVFESADIALTGLPKKEDLMTEFQKGQNDTLKTLLRKMLVFTADKALEPVHQLIAFQQMASNLNFFNKKDQSVATNVIEELSLEQTPRGTATNLRAYTNGVLSGQSLRTSWPEMGARLAGFVAQGRDTAASVAESTAQLTAEGPSVADEAIATTAIPAKTELVSKIISLGRSITGRYATN